jgi:hypothetical protein
MQNAIAAMALFVAAATFFCRRGVLVRRTLRRRLTATLHYAIIRNWQERSRARRACVALMALRPAACFRAPEIAVNDSAIPLPVSRALAKKVRR